MMNPSVKMQNSSGQFPTKFIQHGQAATGAPSPGFTKCLDMLVSLELAPPTAQRSVGVHRHVRPATALVLRSSRL